MTNGIVTEFSIEKQERLKKQKRQKSQAQLKEANRRRVRKHTLKYTYGITIEQYDEMVRKNGGRCMACGQKPTGKKGLHVDHDHKTGKFRGLLCFHCNTALGMARDDPKTLLKLFIYLRSRA